MAGSDDVEAGKRLCAAIYPTPARAVAALLTALSRAGLLPILAWLVLSDEPVNPLRLIRVFSYLCLLPGAAALALRWFLRADLRIDTGALIIEQRRRRIEIPLASIISVEPWRLALPDSGLWLRMRSGKRWSEGIAKADPLALIDALVHHGGSPRLKDGAAHPSLIYARARFRSRPPSWRRALLEFPIFALVPALPLFRVHQIIAYGGALGEYYQYGLGAYLTGFAIYWATLTIYLVLYAAVLRMPVELIAVGSAWLTPHHAPRIRRLLDRAATALFFAGVPAAVILRFAPW